MVAVQIHDMFGICWVVSPRTSFYLRGELVTSFSGSAWKRGWFCSAIGISIALLWKLIAHSTWMDDIKIVCNMSMCYVFFFYGLCIEFDLLTCDIVCKNWSFPMGIGSRSFEVDVVTWDLFIIKHVSSDCGSDQRKHCELLTSTVLQSWGLEGFGPGVVWKAFPTTGDC